jgi:hypothetical protein
MAICVDDTIIVRFGSRLRSSHGWEFCWSHVSTSKLLHTEFHFELNDCIFHQPAFVLTVSWVMNQVSNTNCWAVLGLCITLDISGCPRGSLSYGP